ncbi:CLUMA_CG013870, isoform A [Clunio marinus]|uniref:CLUMA_CG013870, isoform A n=1 Tax=Clunio marinus TaxID=568069 RepID=A0A1J1ILH5_9DIPT|nr:CLUMA_CG013870, isoform A [Clunio marinus]
MGKPNLIVICQNVSQTKQQKIHQNKFCFELFQFRLKLIHQEKELQAQLHYLDQQLRKNSEQFQFESSVNEDNPSIVETREQSTRDVDKENIPVKTDNKILKYAAVGQSDPVSFIKVIKQHVPVEISHPGHPGLHHHSHHQHRQQQKQLNLSTNETSKTLRTLNYLNRLSSRSQADFYQQQEISAPVPSEYDTEPFYINTLENETIKIIPVPYYIDQNGNKREVFTSTSSEHHTDDDELFPSH